MSKDQLSHNPNHLGRPSDAYIEGWVQHINDTGYPESYDGVSNSQPTGDGDVRLLSGEIRVPILRREGGERVPCPICHPRQPWFQIGRAAWFPDEQVVRFIGHDCAKKHLGERYAAADKRYLDERRVKQLAYRHGEVAHHADRLEELLLACIRQAEAMENLRKALDYGPKSKGLSTLLFNELGRNSGHLEVGQDTGVKDAFGKPIYAKRTFCVVRGAEFFQRPFVPHIEASTLLETVQQLRDPLPFWDAAEPDADAEREIVQRGSDADRLPDKTAKLIGLLREAQMFFKPDNMQMVEDWGADDSSGFSSLVCRVVGAELRITTISFSGYKFAQAPFSSEIERTLPEVPAFLITLREGATRFAK